MKNHKKEEGITPEELLNMIEEKHTKKLEIARRAILNIINEQIEIRRTIENEELEKILMIREKVKTILYYLEFNIRFRELPF